MSSNKRSSYFEDSLEKRADTQSTFIDQVFNSTVYKPLPADWVMPVSMEIHTALGPVEIPIHLGTTITDVVKMLIEKVKGTKHFPNDKPWFDHKIVILSPTFVPVVQHHKLAHIFFCNPQWIGQPFHRAVTLNDDVWYATRPPVVFKLDFVDEFTTYAPRPVGYVPNLVVTRCHDYNISVPVFLYYCWVHEFGMLDENKPDFSFEITNSANKHLSGGDVFQKARLSGTESLKSALDIPAADISSWAGNRHLFKYNHYGIEDYFRAEIIIHNKI